MSLFRNLLVNGEEKPKYTPLLYIESTGTQYIDTEMKFDSTNKIILEFVVTEPDKSSANDKWICGTDMSFECGIFSNTFYTGARFSYSQVQDVFARTVAVGLNNTTQSASSYIFARNWNGASGQIKMRLYSFKVFKNNVLVNDLIPAFDSNKVPCLYDTIGDKFYYNAGTGTFNYREAIPYVDLQYIESTGTQYIDTGMAFGINKKIVLDIKITESNVVTANDKWICGTDMTFEGGIISYGFYTSSGFSYSQSSDILARTIVTGTNTTVQSANTYIFARNWNGPNGLIKMRLYSCQIYDNNVLVNDILPVLDDNGVACLYDTITKTLIYNAGSGNFTYSL